MPRAYQVNGETLIVVHLGAHIRQVAAKDNKRFELGLTDVRGKVTVTPRFSHMDVKADDFGPDVPAETLWMLADVNIRMTLVHYDWDVLDLCLSESMGGTVLGDNDGAGIMSPAGTPMRGNAAYLASGYHYVSLGILSPVLGQPWHFPATYLTGPPVEYPLSTEKSAVVCNWRAIPFASGFPFSPGRQEFSSSGAILWDRTLNP